MPEMQPDIQVCFVVGRFPASHFVGNSNNNEL